MASIVYPRTTTDLNQKAQEILSQAKTGGIKHETLKDLKEALQTKTELNIDVLYSIISNLYDVIECLDQKISEISQECSAAKTDIQKLRTDVVQITKKLESQKADTVRLMLGQLAFNLEKAIVKEVLTDVVGSRDHFVNSIKDLHKVLNRKKNFREVLADDAKHKEANRRWIDLQTRLGWKEVHFRCVNFLKYDRVSVAHPEFSYSDVQKAIDENKELDQQYKAAYRELLGMLKTLSII